MDFSTSKTENLFLQMIREFAEKEVKPLAAAVDEEERFPEETVNTLCRSTVHARHLGKFFLTGGLHRLDGLEMLHQRLASGIADSRNII